MEPYIKQREPVAEDKCVDCGAADPHMHNSREVVLGIWPFRQIVRERLPGYLCHKCWTLANPELFPPGPDAQYPWLKQPKKLTETRAAILLGIYLVATLVAVALAILAQRWMEQ